MLNTLKLGMSEDHSTCPQQMNVIKTSGCVGPSKYILNSDSRQELYDTAKDNLLTVAFMLHENGIEVDVDNFHEDLSKTDTLSSYHTEDKPPKMGFLSALPRDDSVLQDAAITDPGSNGGRPGSKRRNTGKTRLCIILFNAN